MPAQRGADAGGLRRRWRGSLFGTDERFALTEGGAGSHLQGEVTSTDGVTIEYAVAVDGGWRTAEAVVHVRGPGGTTDVELAHDAAGWRVGGVRDGRFDACVDVDLGFTPSTNTLPIRRLGLDVGGAARVTAVWLRYPELDVQPLEQEYVRLSQRRWRYSAGSFEAELHVDARGVVVEYGQDLWSTIDENEE